MSAAGEAGGFVHLRVHTEYSLVDSVVRVPALVTAVAGAGMPAVAVTDECNLFAMVKFYRAALAVGVKPIVGVDLLVRETAERAAPVRLTLLCRDARGYGNVTRLVSRAYREGRRHGVPLIERDWLDRDSCEGLIALSGATRGDIGRAFAGAREHEAAQCLDAWLELFGDRFYIELQRL
ncbi:MAG: PHP domain-containing protein, partial [Steroidobacteraceae bacterium]|nr:PHP domain-containing protein [Steroidobacteraceae bacterium]